MSNLYFFIDILEKQHKVFMNRYLFPTATYKMSLRIRQHNSVFQFQLINNDWHNTDHDERSAQRYTLSPGVANYFLVHQITDAAYQ